MILAGARSARVGLAHSIEIGQDGDEQEGDETEEADDGQPHPSYHLSPSKFGVGTTHIFPDLSTNE